jgi:hypothetical protein
MRRTLIKLAVISALLLAPMGGFYWHYERYALSLLHTHQLTPEAANAVKHAYAAAQIYQLLAPIMGDAAAEKSVLFLGAKNEYLEQMFDWSNADSASEIAKDLHNNQVGITAAQWLATQPAHDSARLRTTLLYLAKTRSLVVSADIIANDAFSLHKRLDRLRSAIHQFAENRAGIAATVERTLRAMPKP